MAQYNIIMTATDAGFTATLKKAQVELALLNKQAIILNAGINLLKTGLMTGVISLAAMILPATFAMKAVGDFDANVRRAASIETTFASNTEELTGVLNDMSIQYGVSANELSAGVVEFAKAGFDYNTTMNELFVPTTQLAIANMTDFETSSRIATYTFSLFGDQITDTRELLEKLNVAANISLLNIEEMGSAIEYSGSSAVVAGVKYEEYLAALASLSNLAVKSQQNFGTLISRMMVSGEELNELLGTDGIVVNGVVNLSLLMETLEKTTLTEEQMTKLGEMWGIRSGRIFFSLLKSSKYYSAALEEIYANNDTLTRQSNAMAQSIPAMWQRIKNALTAPIRSPEVLEKMNKALNTLLTALQSGGFATAISEIITQSVDFITKYGPEMMGTMSSFLRMVVTLYPRVADIASVMLKVVKVMSYIPSSFYMTIGAFVMLNKVLPLSSFYSLLAARNINKFANSATEASVATNQYIVQMQRLVSAKQNYAMISQLSQQIMNNEIALMTNQAMEEVLLKQTTEQLMAAKRGDADASMLRRLNEELYNNALDRQTINIRNLVAARTILSFAQREGMTGLVSEAEAMSLVDWANRNLANSEEGLIAVRNRRNTITQMIKTGEYDVAVVQKISGMTTVSNASFEEYLNAVQQGRIITSKALTKAQYDMIMAEILAGKTTASLTTRLNMMMTVGMFSVLQGFMLFIQSKNPIIQALGAITIAVGGLASALIALGIAEELSKGLIGIATALTVAGFAVMMLEQNAAMKRSQRESIKGDISELMKEPITMPTYTSPEYVSPEVAAPPTNMEYYASQTGGLVKKTGWRFIHKGEFVVPEKNVAAVKKSTETESESTNVLNTLAMNTEKNNIIITKNISESVSKLVETITSEKRFTAESISGKVEEIEMGAKNLPIIKLKGEITEITKAPIYKLKVGEVKTAIPETEIAETPTISQSFVSSDKTYREILDKITDRNTMVSESFVKSKETYEELINKLVERKETASETITNIANIFREMIERTIGIKTTTFVNEEKIGSAKGGLVKTEGWRYIHSGEFIVPEKEVATVKKAAEPESVSTNIIQTLREKDRKRETELTERTTEVNKTFILPLITKERLTEAHEKIERVGPKEIYKTVLREFGSMAFHALPKEVVHEKEIEKTIVEHLIPVKGEKEKEVGSITGGFVEKEGWRFVHSGEFIIPPKETAIVRTLATDDVDLHEHPRGPYDEPAINYNELGLGFLDILGKWLRGGAGATAATPYPEHPKPTEYVLEGDIKLVIAPGDLSKLYPAGETTVVGGRRYLEQQKYPTIIVDRFATLEDAIDRNTDVVEKEITTGHKDKSGAQNVFKEWRMIADFLHLPGSKVEEKERKEEEERKKALEDYAMREAETLTQLPTLEAPDHTTEEVTRWMNMASLAVEQGREIPQNLQYIGAERLPGLPEEWQPYTYVPTVQATIPTPTPSPNIQPWLDRVKPVTPSAVTNDNRIINVYQVAKEDWDRYVNLES